MKSFQEYVKTLNTIIDEGKTSNVDVRPQLDDLFSEDFINTLPKLLAQTDSPANAMEAKYQFYLLLAPAFEHYRNSRDGRMLRDKKTLNKLQTKLGKPLMELIRPNQMSQQAELQKKTDELNQQAAKLQQSVSNIFQSLVSFNLPNVQANANIDELIVRTVRSSPQHKILGIDSGGHSTIECRKKDGTSLFFGFYVHERAEEPTWMAKGAKQLGIPSPDKKVARFVTLEADHLQELYEGIHIPCDGVLDIDKAMDYLIEHKFSDFDPESLEPMRHDYQLYSKNCSYFVREALMKAQGEHPLPYEGATLLGLDTPMAVHAYAKQLREKVLFEQARTIRLASPVENDKTHLIQAIQALEALDITGKTYQDRLLVHTLVQRLITVVNFPVDIPFLYQDMQEIIHKIQTFNPASSFLKNIHPILLTASQALFNYRQRVELITEKGNVIAAVSRLKLNPPLDPESLKTTPDMLGFINKTLADMKHDDGNKDRSTALKTLESIRGRLHEQMYFPRDATSQNGFIKKINQLILPNMLFETAQPSMSNLIEIAIQAWSIQSSKPFHPREDETKHALKTICSESTLALPAKLLAVKQTINEHAPWWMRWLPKWALFTKSLRDTQMAFEKLENQAQLLCVMDTFVKGKITSDEWQSHLKTFNDWISDGDITSVEHSYSRISNALGIQSQIVAEKPLEQHSKGLHTVNQPSLQTLEEDVPDLNDDEEDEPYGMKF